MIYVISKSTFGSYNVRDIQCNANWDCCPYSDYALIPDSMVNGILATKGYCDITLNSAGTEVVSYTARTIPSVQEECCGTNTVLSVNGVKANTDGEVTLTASNVGARPNTWTPTAAEVGAAASSHNHSASEITSGTLPISRGGTGATSAAKARTKLGVPEYEEGTWTPTDVNSCGLVWSSSTILYTKVGRFVHVLLKFKTASSVTNKAIKIGGLPFTPNCTYPTTLGLWTKAYNNQTQATGYVVTNGNGDSYAITLKDSANNDATDSTMGANMDMTLSLYYQIKV